MEKNNDILEEIVYTSDNLKYYSDKKKFELRELKKIKYLLPGYSLILGVWLYKSIDEISMYVVVIKNKKVEKIFGLATPLTEGSPLINFEKMFLRQISLFKILDLCSFQYDFNHDGNDEILTFTQSAVTGFVHCRLYVINVYSDGIKKVLDISDFPTFLLYPEFINYKFRQGIKFFNGEAWVFYYYDRIRQEYVMDETASSEELAQIHGSPDFFAEAGIDYTKLERPLVAADLEGFSKAALRIWRNAVYAKHGRTFKSEDLQALFNEYVWYKADENYTDGKLSDTDKANIRLIQEAEAKLEH